jgi:hypothetical protein
MPAEKSINTTYLLCLTAIPALSLAGKNISASPQSSIGKPQTTNDNVVLYLGNIKVRGQRNIIKTLQAIKLALQQPYSSDPTLANVMICRLRDQAGSHLRQWLTCGTNRVLAEHRDALQTNMAFMQPDTDHPSDPGEPGTASCAGSACYEEASAALGNIVGAQPDRYLRTSVNGPAFRALLEKIPYPYPAAAIPKTGAPTAGTRQP